MIKELILKIIKRTNNKYKDLSCTIAHEVELVNCKLLEYCNLAHHCSVNNSEIGKRTSVGRYSKIRDSKIGAYCSISWDVTIGAVSHPMDRVSMHAFTYRKQFGIVDKDIVLEQKTTIVGNDVWIGCGAIILSGVTIGDGAIIGAGAVVTKDVEPYTIVAGVPAKEIRKRFDEYTVKKLLELKWWNLRDDKLRDNIKIFEKKIDKETIKELEQIKEGK